MQRMQGMSNEELAKEMISQGQEGPTIPPSVQSVYEYIVDVVLGRSINGIVFREDPKGYLAAWRKKRGGTEEFRMPEDSARGTVSRWVSENIE